MRFCIAGTTATPERVSIYGLTGLEKCSGGTVTLCGHDISHASIRCHRSVRTWLAIPETAMGTDWCWTLPLWNKHGAPALPGACLQHMGFVKQGEVRAYAGADRAVRRAPPTGAGDHCPFMSGGNQVEGHHCPRGRPGEVADCAGKPPHAARTCKLLSGLTVPQLVAGGG